MRSLALFFLLATSSTVSSTSLVYNLKIRRSFDVPPRVLQRERKFLWLLSAVPIIYARKRHIVAPQLKQNIFEKTFLGGSLFNIRLLAPRHWWAELTTGVERQTLKTHSTQNFKVSHTGMDDIVLSVGKNFVFDHAAQVGLYGLAGFPTRRKVTPFEVEDTLVGTRFFGAGVGGEASYNFFSSQQRALTGITQARFIHFFDRKWFPILPCNGEIQPGNVSDIFLLLNYREKKNIFEIGYDATFFTQQAARVECTTIKSPHVTRNSFYTSYSRLFTKKSLIKRPGLLGCGFTYCREKVLDSNIFIFWLNFSLLF